MTTGTNVTVGSRTYTVVEDTSWVFRVLVRGHVHDETTGAPLDESFEVRVDQPGLRVRTFPAGVYCLSGYCERDLAPLTAAPLTLALTVRAAGFLPATVSVAVPADGVLPVTAPTVTLRRAPVIVSGRVMQAGVPRRPVEGAVIRLITPRALALRTPLRFSHATGTVVRERALDPDPDVRRLTAAVSAGARRLTVDVQTGIASGDLIVLDPVRRSEHAVVDRVLPVGLALTAPLARSYAANTDVRLISTLGAPGSAAALDGDALAGEAVLLLTVGLTGAQVDVPDGAATEFGAAGTVTDALGFYVLPGVARLREAQWRAVAPGVGAATVVAAIDYDQPVNTVNFLL